MDVTVEYQRDLAGPTATRVASHFTNAARRLVSVVLSQAPATQAAIQAQAQDISYMTADALALLPGLENAENPALHATVAALTAQMQQMNAQLTAQIQQMSAQLTAQMQQMNAQLTAQMQQMNAQMQQMNVQLNGRIDHFSLTVTLAMNSNASHLENAAFLPFPNQNNVISALFPRSSDQLRALTGQEMTQLLHHYHIQAVPNPLHARRERVRRLITTGE